MLTDWADPPAVVATICDIVKDASASSSLAPVKRSDAPSVTVNVVLTSVELISSSALGVSLIPITVIVKSVFPLIVKSSYTISPGSSASVNVLSAR